MPLAPGARLGSYEIRSALGAGGMGEVYRARDTKLNRDVALKVIPDTFALDPDRLARFKREAQVLASLNHPHIAAIYGFEDSGETHALVLELVEGETLADRITRGPIPLDEALQIAKQIAEALEAAHEQGIIHRDLKPANIKVTSNAVVKVLDFGLAKLVETPSGTAGGQHALSMSPTITSPAMMTGVGVLLGTAAYMSPEQAKGRPADKRSDIWAFGCVLYEMLTGRRAFEGEDVADTIANTLKIDPNLNLLPTATPRAICALLKECLRKDRLARVSDVAAIRFVLAHADDLIRSRTDAGMPSATDQRWQWRHLLLASAAAAIAVLATLAMVRTLNTPSLPSVSRFTISAPSNGIFVGALGIPRFAVSPDGQSVVFAAGSADRGRFELWIRRFDRIESQPLPATTTSNGNSVQGLFWLADGNSVGYFDEPAHKLKTVDLATGVIRTLVDVPPNQYSGSANVDGVILYSSLGTGGVMRIAASGGSVQKVTTLQQGEIAHLWPSFLPDGRHFIYLAQATAREDWGLYAGSFDTRERKLIVRAAGMGQFAPPDQLLYLRGDSLFAQRFDVSALAVTGEPVLVTQPVVMTAAGRAGFSASNTGVLVHARDVAGENTSPRAVTWVDRNGREEAVGVPVRPYSHVQLAPDATRLVVSVDEQENDLWIWNLARKTFTRLTFGTWREGNPLWTPDSKQIIFQSDPTGHFSLYSIAADGTGVPEQLVEGPFNQRPTSISPDGKELIFEEDTLTSGSDLHAVSLDRPRRTRELISEPANQRNGIISPDGRWIAYQSSESGPYEVYVRPYPATAGGRWQVSTNGGAQPLWSRDGKELFYVSSQNSVMGVRVDARDIWSATTATAVFVQPAATFGSVGGVPGATGLTYDIAADARRFLILKPTTTADESNVGAQIVVVQNWLQDLKQFSPADKP